MLISLCGCSGSGIGTEKAENTFGTKRLMTCRGLNQLSDSGSTSCLGSLCCVDNASDKYLMISHEVAEVAEPDYPICEVECV